METCLEKRIRKKMIDAEIKGANIARGIGVHRSAINKAIKGNLKSFRLRKAIADALQVKVADLWPPEKEKSL
jgi:hypothetical protein